MRGRVDQKGVALISVLLVTSLALLVVGGLLRSHRFTLNGTAQQVHQLHLRQAALVAEGLGIQLLLAADLQKGRTVHLAQNWATQAERFRLPDIDVRLAIEDLSGRFNLTRLTVSGGLDDVHAQRWSRLLDALGIAPFDLALFTDQALTNAAQLQRIPGLRKGDLRRLMPWVAVLPKHAALNVNTASPSVLASLEGMTPGSAKALAMSRPAEGYPDAAAFAQSPLAQGAGISTHGLGVHSRWFRITAVVSLAGERLELVSDVERVANTQRVRVLQRRFGRSTVEDTL